MDEILTERSDGVLRVQLNRPAKLNAMTAAMYIALAEIFSPVKSNIGPTGEWSPGIHFG